MDPELQLEPELLPPVLLAPEPRRLAPGRSAIAGVALAAVLGMWGIHSVASTGNEHQPSIAARSTGQSAALPAALALVPVSAGQPAVLTPPADADASAAAGAEVAP
jgi:hypothetical protein